MRSLIRRLLLFFMLIFRCSISTTSPTPDIIGPRTPYALYKMPHGLLPQSHLTLVYRIVPSATNRVFFNMYKKAPSVNKETDFFNLDIDMSSNKIQYKYYDPPSATVISVPKDYTYVEYAKDDWRRIEIFALGESLVYIIYQGAYKDSVNIVRAADFKYITLFNSIDVNSVYVKHYHPNEYSVGGSSQRKFGGFSSDKELFAVMRFWGPLPCPTNEYNNDMFVQLLPIDYIAKMKAYNEGMLVITKKCATNKISLHIVNQTKEGVNNSVKEVVCQEVFGIVTHFKITMKDKNTFHVSILYEGNGVDVSKADKYFSDPCVIQHPSMFDYSKGFRLNEQQSVYFIDLINK